jgi:uncharacterized protein with GYD domain
MTTFMCFLNWTDQGAKAVKDGPKRYEATKELVSNSADDWFVPMSPLVNTMSFS